MLNLFRFVGLRHLRMKPVRTLLTTLGVAFGVALYIAIVIINRSTLTSFRDSIDAVAGKATLSVSGSEAGFPEERLETIARVPGVKHAAPMIEARAYFAGDSTATRTLMILGVDMLKETSVRTYKTTDEEIIEDPLSFLNQPDSIILTHAFAQANGLEVDSKFSVATVRGTRQLTVRGLLSPEGPAKAYGGGIAIMDIDGARVTFGKEGKLDRVDVITARGAPIDEVAGRLRSTLGPGFVVERPETQGENMEKMVKTYQAMLTVFSTLALLVGVFLVMNSISIAVAERRREIGTLRALGAERRGILALFLTEALAMGALGSFLGVWLGRKLAGYMVATVTFSMSGQYLMKMEVPKLQFQRSDFTQAVLIGAFVALLAALWPSLRATLIQPLDAMRKNDPEAQRARGITRFSPHLGAALLAFFAASTLNSWGTSHAILAWIDQASAMIGAALLGPAIVGWLIRFTAPILIPLGGAVARLADDNLMRNPRRTGSNVMSLMVGLILVIMIAAVNVSFRDTVIGWFEEAFRYDLLVSSTGQVISFQSQPIHEDLGPEIAATPGLKKSPTGSAYGMRFIHVEYQGRRIGLKAYDRPDPDFGYSTIPIVDRPKEEAGAELFDSSDRTVLVSSNFVLHFGVKRGDFLQIPTPQGVVPFRVIGTVDDYASAAGVLYMKRTTYKELWKDPLVTVYAINLAPGADLEAVRKEIDRRFGQSKNLMTISNQDFRRQMTELIDQSFAYTDAIKLAALLVGLLGLFNTFLISVMERTRELGMLRAVGMSRAQMRSMILVEALIQGAFGALAATALGAMISFLWIKGNLAHILGWIIRFHFPWMGVLTTVAIGVFVALLAGLFPAWRASHLEIREALEYE